MQNRHTDRFQYFMEQANTSREYYLPLIRASFEVSKGMNVLEIGCGEGGNLIPFAELGCEVTGIDLDSTRIKQAGLFFERSGYTGTFIHSDFMAVPPPAKRFDIVIIHDVIEHVPDKDGFIRHIEPWLDDQGIVFWGFPVWQMPFGGHQQICRSRFLSHAPFIHLLPLRTYTFLLKKFGEPAAHIRELSHIKQCKVTIALFEHLMRNRHYVMVSRTLWFINPHYEQKFGFKPRRLNRLIARIRCIRGYFTTSCWYIVRRE